MRGAVYLSRDFFLRSTQQHTEEEQRSGAKRNTEEERSEAEHRGGAAQQQLRAKVPSNPARARFRPPGRHLWGPEMEIRGPGGGRCCQNL